MLEPKDSELNIPLWVRNDSVGAIFVENSLYDGSSLQEVVFGVVTNIGSAPGARFPIVPERVRFSSKNADIAHNLRSVCSTDIFKLTVG